MKMDRRAFTQTYAFRQAAKQAFAYWARTRRFRTRGRSRERRPRIDAVLELYSG